MADHFGKTVTTDGVRGHGENFFLGLLAGVVAAIISAGVWAAIALNAAKLGVIPIGLMGIAVGFLVGMAVRFAGNGQGAVFGITGAVLALAGCVGGEMLTVAQQHAVAGKDIIATLTSANWPTIFNIVITGLQRDLMTCVGILVAMWEGFSLSRRK